MYMYLIITSVTFGPAGKVFIRHLSQILQEVIDIVNAIVTCTSSHVHTLYSRSFYQKITSYKIFSVRPVQPGYENENETDTHVSF